MFSRPYLVWFSVAVQMTAQLQAIDHYLSTKSATNTLHITIYSTNILLTVIVKSTIRAWQINN